MKSTRLPACWMTVFVLGSALVFGPERVAAQRPLGIDVFTSYQGSAQKSPHEHQLGEREKRRNHVLLGQGYRRNRLH